MPTQKFDNVTPPVFQNFSNAIAAAVPGTNPPAQHKDGSIRGHAEKPVEVSNIPSAIVVDYVWKPIESVLIVDVQTPLGIPAAQVQAHIAAAVDAAKGAQLFGPG